MASMAPISGGQYHWVSEFAPPSLQQFLSYIVGWMSTLSWQAGNASGSFLTGTIIQALLVVNYPDYEPERYQGTLLVFAMVIVLCVVNIWASDIWARIQNGLLILHIIVFLAVIITLWVLAPHQSAKAVFTEFTNSGGWPTMGLSLMVGQITALYAMLGRSLCSAPGLSQTLLMQRNRKRCDGTYVRGSARRRSLRPNFTLLVIYRERSHGHHPPDHLPL